jgi:hypothetical protein
LLLRCLPLLQGLGVETGQTQPAAGAVMFELTTGDASRKRAAAGSGLPDAGTPTMKVTLRPQRSGNVTASPGRPRIRRTRTTGERQAVPLVRDAEA